MTYIDQIQLSLSVLVALIAFLELKLVQFMWWNVQMDGKDIVTFMLINIGSFIFLRKALTKTLGTKRTKLTSEEWKTALLRNVVTAPLLIAITTWFLVTLGNAL